MAMLDKEKNTRIKAKDAKEKLIAARALEEPDDNFNLNLPKTGEKDLDEHYEKDGKFTWPARFFEAPASKVERIDLKNRNYYYGETRDGKPHGRGAKVWLSYDSPAILEAWYKDDVATGEGRLINSKGEVYHGKFENNKKNGHGILTFSTGSKYEGNW